MKERVDQLGAHFLLSSSIGQGTSITIECTVNEEVEY
jgi:signal transduction histidine kinase